MTPPPRPPSDQQPGGGEQPGDHAASAVRAAPVVERGLVLVASGDGTLYAVPD